MGITFSSPKAIVSTTERVLPSKLATNKYLPDRSVSLPLGALPTLMLSKTCRVAEFITVISLLDQLDT